MRLLGRYGKETRLRPSEVIDLAVGFFGKGGLGLELKERSEEMVCFEGGGGHVTIIACPGERTDVDLETREWDYQVKRFVDKL